ncbi:MAG: 4-oxalocrotonate tautomerase [Deltaproteobacteria bacterium]|nr:4-oxalocrotonate tautomerase [Deltaproteobacteria bacterium]
MANIVEAIAKDVVAFANREEKWVSVAIEEIKPDDWAEKVYKPDILDKAENLYKKPGYNPFNS